MFHQNFGLSRAIAIKLCTNLVIVIFRMTANKTTRHFIQYYIYYYNNKSRI